MIKERFNALSKKIFKPITENPAFFFSILLLLLLPISIQCFKTNDWRYGMYASPINVIVAYNICFISLISHHHKHIIKIILGGGIFLVAAIECFLILFFGVGCTATILSLILNTNINEACGFITNYLFTLNFLIFLISAIGIFLVLTYLNRISRDIKIDIKSKKLSIPLAIGILIGITLCGYRDIRALTFYTTYHDLQTLLYQRNQAKFAANYTTFGSIIFNCLCYFREANYQTELLKSQNFNISHSDIRSPHIILIIGEAFNKHHSSLYGYDKKTNPALQQELDAENLYLFNDVITPYNTTINCMRSIFSFQSQDRRETWYKTPLFPVCFRKGGYYVTFYSNQETFDINKSLHYCPVKVDK